MVPEMSVARRIAVAVIIGAVLSAIWAYIAYVLDLYNRYGWIVTNFIPIVIIVLIAMWIAGRVAGEERYEW